MRDGKLSRPDQPTTWLAFAGLVEAVVSLICPPPARILFLVRRPAYGPNAINVPPAEIVTDGVLVEKRWPSIAYDLGNDNKLRHP